MAIKTISPQDLYKHIKLGHSVVLLDVRSQGEFEEAHIMGAKSYPLDSFNALEIIHKVCLPYPTPPTIYVTCSSGTDGMKACQHLFEAGHEYISNLEGGMQAWMAAEFPIHKAKSFDSSCLESVSLNQKIQIAAGSIITVGTLLGTLVNVAFLALPFLAGVSFLYEGIFGPGDWKQTLVKAFGNS